MCTVTFLPLGENGCIITSNRDESPARPAATFPQQHTIHGLPVYFPQDPLAGGTWFAVGQNGYILVVLNGGDKGHIPRPPYRKSRGLVMLDFFLYNNAHQYATGYDFEGIEPFSLIIAHSGKKELYRLRWDGANALLQPNDFYQPHIWSSATLYTPQNVLQRQQWFDGWLQQHPVYTVENIRHFHHFGGTGDIYNDIRMNRTRVQTVSITSVQSINGQTTLWYEDLLTNQLHKTQLPG